MKSLGFKLLPIARINEPHDLQARRSQQNVADLAASIKAGVLMNPLTVTKVGDRYDIVAGGDRFAALGLAGVKMVGCHLIEGTPDELANATEAENLYRRPPGDRAVAMAKRVEQLADRTSATVSPKTRVVNARKQVAREAGVKPATVKKAEQRERARAKDSGPEVASSVPAKGPNAIPGKGVNPGPRKGVPPIPIDTHGIEVTPEFAERMSAIQAALEHANSLLVQAQGVLAPLATNPAWEQARYQRLKDAAHRLAFECRQWKPASVCVYCRMGAGQAKCNGCRGMGWLSAEAMEIVPKYMLEGNAEPPQPWKPALHQIKIIDENDAPILPPEDAPPHDLTFEPFDDTDGGDAS